MQWNPKIKHYISYSLSYLLIGGSIVSLGPLIPYIANQIHRDERTFAFLFLLRSFGFILSGFLIKLIIKILSYHQTILISSVLLGLFCILFSLSKLPLFLGLLIFLISLNLGIIQITVNLCLTEGGLSNKDTDFWLQAATGFFGVGGIVGPTLVYIFQSKTYMIIGIISCCLSLSYFFLESPEKQRIQKELLTNPQTVIDNNNKFKNYSLTPQFIVYRLCLTLFIYLGLMITISGWISTYAVVKKVSTKEQATIYVLLNYIGITTSRFIFAFIPGKVSFKLKICTFGCFMVCLLSVGGSFAHLYIPIIWLLSVGLGAFLGPVFSYLMTLPLEFGLELQPNQRANMIISRAFGQTVVGTLVGYFMNWICEDMLIYSLVFLSCIYLVIVLTTIQQLQKKQPQVFDLQFQQ